MRYVVCTQEKKTNQWLFSLVRSPNHVLTMTRGTRRAGSTHFIQSLSYSTQSIFHCVQLTLFVVHLESDSINVAGTIEQTINCSRSV